MAFSKVTLNGTTLMDVTQDTVTPATLVENETATQNNGEHISGSLVIEDAKTRVPVYGMGKNLLDNWYFLNPVNQRGVTTFSLNGYFIDRWALQHASNYGVVQLTSSGLSITHAQSTGYSQIEQVILGLTDATCTLSGIVDGQLETINFVFNSQGSGKAFGRLMVYSVSNKIIFRCNSSTSDVIIKALKLELGTEQTLCHNEGTDESPVWVLNEIPDYEYELYRCMTSTADPSDTYANKSIATEQQLAYVETGTTATKTNGYAAGEYFCWHGLLYRAKTVIGNGNTFTENTNCEQVTEGGFNSLKAQTFVRRQSLATSITTGLNEWNVIADTVSGYKPVGIVGVQFAALPRSAVTLSQFLMDGTNISVSVQSTQERTSGISVNAFVLYAKE